MHWIAGFRLSIAFISKIFFPIYYISYIFLFQSPPAMPTFQPTRPDPVHLCRLPCSHASNGNHPELVSGFGFQGENVSAAGRTGLLLDGAVLIGFALPVLKFWSFHLDVEAFDPETHVTCFSFNIFLHVSVKLNSKFQCCFFSQQNRMVHMLHNIYTPISLFIRGVAILPISCWAMQMQNKKAEILVLPRQPASPGCTCNNRHGRDFPGQHDDGSIRVREETGSWDLWA